MYIFQKINSFFQDHFFQIYVKNRIYRPHLARKFNLRQFRMENDRKNGAVLAIILPARFENHIISKNNVIFSGPFFLKRAATAASTAKHDGSWIHDPSCICMNHHINSKNNVIFSGPFFLKNVFPQIHFIYCSGRGSGRCRLWIKNYLL